MNYKYTLIILISIFIPLTVFGILFHLKSYTLIFNKNIYISDIVKEYIPYNDDFVIGKITSTSTFTFIIPDQLRRIKLDKRKIKIKYIKIDSLKERIKEYLRYKLSNDSSDCETIIKSQLPSSNDYDILLQTYPPIGWVTVKLFKKNKPYRNVSVYVKVFKNVYIAKNNIFPKSTINESNIEKSLVDITNIYRMLPDKVIGMMAKYYIRKGNVILSNYIMQPYDIVQGERVLMIVKYKNIIISDYGIALTNGRIGDIVRIMNVKSRNIVIGKVVQKGIIEVIIR